VRGAWAIGSPSSMFGILRVGAALIDVNPMHAPPELKHQHHHAGVETIVVHAPATPT